MTIGPTVGRGPEHRALFISMIKYADHSGGSHGRDRTHDHHFAL